MSYEKAMDVVKSEKNKHHLLDCTEFSYEVEGVGGSSIVPEVRLCPFGVSAVRRAEEGNATTNEF